MRPLGRCGAPSSDRPLSPVDSRFGAAAAGGYFITSVWHDRSAWDAEIFRASRMYIRTLARSSEEAWMYEQQDLARLRSFLPPEAADLFAGLG